MVLIVILYSVRISSHEQQNQLNDLGIYKVSLLVDWFDKTG
jgi:hypothetical protein